MGAVAFFNKPASYLGEQVYTNEPGLFVRESMMRTNSYIGSHSVKAIYSIFLVVWLLCACSTPLSEEERIQGVHQSTIDSFKAIGREEYGPAYIELVNFLEATKIPALPEYIYPDIMRFVKLSQNNELIKDAEFVKSKSTVFTEQYCKLVNVSDDAFLYLFKTLDLLKTEDNIDEIVEKAVYNHAVFQELRGGGNGGLSTTPEFF
jgi:hypothetical protein